MTLEQYVKLWKMVWERWDLHGNNSVTETDVHAIYLLNSWLADYPIVTSDAERIMIDLSNAGTTPTPDMLHKTIRQHCRRPGRHVVEWRDGRAVEVPVPPDVSHDEAARAAAEWIPKIRAALARKVAHGDQYRWPEQPEVTA